MSRLVSLDDAKRQIRIVGDDSDDEVQFYLDVAEEMVIDHVDQRLQDDDGVWSGTVAAWDEDTAPMRVKAAVVLLVAEFWAHRGDEEDPSRKYGDLPQRVIALLQTLRDPTVA